MVFDKIISVKFAPSNITPEKLQFVKLKPVRSRFDKFEFVISRFGPIIIFLLLLCNCKILQFSLIWCPYKIKNQFH